MYWSSGGAGGGASVGSSTPSTQAHGDSAASGSSEDACRVDHKHAMPAEGSAPSGLMGYFTGSCPTGWSEYTTARGRYIVGTPSGGTGEGTVGTVLTAEETRAVGQHSHGYPNYGGGGNLNHSVAGPPGSNAYYVFGSSATDNTGNVAGTNAPYIQLTVCKKD